MKVNHVPENEFFMNSHSFNLQHINYFWKHDCMELYALLCIQLLIIFDVSVFFRELARQKGCGFITVDCTSHYTACAAKKLGFKLHYTLNYEDYKVDGKTVFRPAHPHKELTVYTQRII